ncbi:MAG: type II toxin-antitoxin system HicB family antitoxin [Candidatus Hydrogenedentes bacterium]|nr:type II toxin-antitoxin system HicB family antitoxin [Candidatus Hydrogenedentota bacterium]
MTTKTFIAIVVREGNLFVATCPETGIVSQGESVESALANLKEATELYIEEFSLSEGSSPIMTTFEATLHV